MAEAMSEAVLAEMERNAHVRCDCGSCDGDDFGLTGREAAVLLAEARRARQAEADLRATQPPLTDEWGIGTDYTDTTRSEQAVSDNLAEALHLLDIARIHRRPHVVSEGLIVREVGEWRKPEEER